MISRARKERARDILTGLGIVITIYAVVELIFIFPKIMGILALIIFVGLIGHLIYEAFIAKTE